MKHILLFCALIAITYGAKAQDTWTRKADFAGDSRTEATGFSIGSKGYIGTGTSTNGNDFWRYDPSTDTWTQIADFGGGARRGAVGFSIGNKGYVGTGYGTDYMSDFWEYDPLSNAWTKKADFGGGAREYAVGFIIGNKGYIGTGEVKDEFQTYYFKDFWEYDPINNVWTKKTDFAGSARSHAIGFSISGKGYLGGSGKDFWEYDQQTNTWAAKADLTGSDYNVAAGFSIGNKGYIEFALGDFWEYDPAINTWTQKTSHPAGFRLYTVGLSIGNKGYVGTGLSQLNNGNDFWEYSPLFTINTGAISGSAFCAGSSVSVPFTATTTFNSGNVFTAQLSDGAGSFANPVNIGTLNSTISGNISAVIPSNAANGSAYRIRVISSNPAVTGSDNGTDITISALAYFYRDADFDGYGDPHSSPFLTCGSLFGYVANNLDCDDTKPYVHPGAAEICGDGIDDNCDGQIDEGCSICANATNLTTTNITDNSATLNWSASINPVKWQIQYKKVGSASWTKLNPAASARSVKVSSLDAGKSYKWHIRAKCGTTWTVYSDTVQFKTLKKQQLLNTEQSVASKYPNTENKLALNLYPNPTSGQFVLELHLANNINANARIELLNIPGKIMHTETVNISNGVLQKNISISSSLTSGIYLVRIMVNDKVYQAKLVYSK